MLHPHDVKRGVDNAFVDGHVSAPPVTTGIVTQIAHTSSPFQTTSHDFWQHFGFASVPMLLSKVVRACVGGKNGNSIAFASHDSRYYPPNMVPGETQIYDAFGQSVYFKANGTIVVNGKNEIDVNINGENIGKFTSSLITLNKDVMVNGSIMSTGDVMAGPNSISLINHVNTGVMSGDNNSGPPLA